MGEEEVIACPEKWHNFQNNCYYIDNSTTSLSWKSAESECQKLDKRSFLPSVHSALEMEVLNINTDNQTFWLGGSREILAKYKELSSWTWSDGTPMDFIAWSTNQPNNYWYGERCIRSIGIKEGSSNHVNTWDDHSCYWRPSKVDALVCKLKIEN